MGVRKTVYFNEEEQYLLDMVEGKFSDYIKKLMKERHDPQLALSKEIMDYIDSRVKKWNVEVVHDDVVDVTVDIPF